MAGVLLVLVIKNLLSISNNLLNYGVFIDSSTLNACKITIITLMLFIVLIDI
jgi:hypothetical protein